MRPLGIQPQRSSGELQALGCALAVFVPFATGSPLAGLVQWGRHGQSTGGVGMCKRRSTSDGDTRSTCMRSRKATCQRRRRWRPAGRCSLGLRRRWGDGPVSPDGWSADREDPMARSQSRGVGPLEPASHAHRQGHHPAAPASAGGGLGGYRGAQAAFVAGSRAPGHQHGPPGGLAQ